MEVTTLNIGSMPENRLGDLKLDGLVFVANPDVRSEYRLGAAFESLTSFAQTTGIGHYPIFACTDQELPAGRYAISTDRSAMLEERLDEILRAMDGLGVATLGLYFGLGRNMSFQITSFVRKVATWLNGHHHSFKAVYILSATDKSMWHPSSDWAREYPAVRIVPTTYGTSADQDYRYYFERTSVDTVALTGVALIERQAGSPLLTLPWMVRMPGGECMVTEIRSSAFEGGTPILEQNWRNDVGRIEIPSCVINADLEAIARHFPCLDEIVTHPSNRHLKNRKWLRESLAEEEGAELFFSAEDCLEKE